MQGMGVAWQWIALSSEPADQISSRALNGFKGED